MAKAFAWAGDSGGCGWYRTVIVAEALRQLGHDVGHGIEFDGDAYADADAVLGQRVHNPGSSVAWARWNFQHEKTTVFDADDDYFHMHQHPEFGAAAVEYGNPRVQARLLGNAASATYTTCATSRIAEVFAQFCDNVVVVPNGLPERYLERPAPYDMTLSRDTEPKYRPVVGWAGSSFTQWELTTNVKDTLSRVDEWGGKLHVVGVPYPVMRKTGLVKPGVSVTGWVDGTANYLDTIDFDIWVAPYRQSDYNNAKVPTKALEAAFLGIPIVASATAPYRGFVKDGVTGFLVEPGGDWDTPIRELINNPGLREAMGRAAREVAVEFTIEKLASQLWEKILFGGRP